MFFDCYAYVYDVLRENLYCITRRPVFFHIFLLHIIYIFNVVNGHGPFVLQSCTLTHACARAIAVFIFRKVIEKKKKKKPVDLVNETSRTRFGENDASVFGNYLRGSVATPRRYGNKIL